MIEWNISLHIEMKKSFIVRKDNYSQSENILHYLHYKKEKFMHST